MKLPESHEDSLHHVRVRDGHDDTHEHGKQMIL